MSEINKDVLDNLLKDCKTSEDILGENGLIKNLVKSVLERALAGELTNHLGYDKHDPSGHNSGNSRNGNTIKQVKGNFGDVDIEIPRDRNSSFEPKIIGKNQTRFDGFDDKIISLYARGMSTRDIQYQLKDLYGVEISSSLISNVTESVMEEVKIWQNRPLDSVYPIVYLDALVVKIKENKQVINKSIYLALGINMDGQKELLGMWSSQSEGSKFWLGVLTELKNRGIQDIFISCVDGLKGFPDAIEAVFPLTTVQLCIVHQIRNSLRYVGYKERKKVAQDLKTVYTASTADDAEIALELFSDTWDKKYPAISKQWLNNWENITPFFDFPADIRKVIYTTNSIESLNMTVRKVIKNKRFFPSDEAAYKQIYLALNNISKKWTMPIKDWNYALNWFAIKYENRFPKK